MTAHACREFNTHCYRCDLASDEEISGIAEEYHEVMLEPGLAMTGLGDDAISWLRRQYIRDATANPEAVRQLYEWAAMRALGDETRWAPWTVRDCFASNA